MKIVVVAVIVICKRINKSMHMIWLKIIRKFTCTKLMLIIILVNMITLSTLMIFFFSCSFKISINKFEIL